MIYVKKKLNHNALLIEDGGVEKIAMGKGIGFSNNVGAIVHIDQVDKIFILDSKEQVQRFGELTGRIPLEHIIFSEEVISYIERELQTKLDANIYIALTDHISFAVQRVKEAINTSIIFLPEMRLFYPTEFAVAKQVVKKINKKFDLELNENEVGFITMHIINAEIGETNNLNTLKILEMTSVLLQLVEQKLDRIFDTGSLSYSRLIIHLKFLVKRIVYMEQSDVIELAEIEDKVKQTNYYQVAEECIKDFQKKYDVCCGNNEILYLAIHLARI